MRSECLWRLGAGIGTNDRTGPTYSPPQGADLCDRARAAVIQGHGARGAVSDEQVDALRERHAERQSTCRRGCLPDAAWQCTGRQHSRVRGL